VCNDTERQNMSSEISEKCLLILQQEMDFYLRRKIACRMLCKERKKWDSLVGSRIVWKLKGMKKDR